VSVLVRPVEPEDYRAVHALCSHPAVAPSLGTSPFDPPEVWRRRLADPDPDHVHHLSAWQGRRLAGTIRLEVSSRPRSRHVGELSVAVHPEFQGQGIGSRLLAAVVDLADRWLNLVRLELNVHADNARAVRLYEKHGFAIEVRRRMDMMRDGVPVDGLTMGRLRPGFVPGPIPPPPAWPARRKAPGEVAIRPVSVDDAAALARIHRNESVVWGTLQLPTLSVEAWRRRLAANDPDRTRLVIAEVDGVPAGAGGVHGFGNPRLRHMVHLGMAVHPDFQGMGVGGELLGALVDAARSGFGARRIELEVYPDNERAARLYERAGFAAEGLRRAAVFRDGVHVDTRVMALIR
jgi:putative acetyltransferase